MALRDTITQIQTRDNELSAIANDRENFLALWIDDLKSLYLQVQFLLNDLADEGKVSFSSSIHKITEDELGEYEAPGLILVIASRAIIMAPIARLTSGGAGRVDLMRRDRPSEMDRVFVVRRRDEEKNFYWAIEQKGEPDPLSKINFAVSSSIGRLINRPTRVYSVLSKSALEAALDFLLKNA